MKILLSGWGCDVRVAESVSAAAAIGGDGSPRPDAILADYHLDDGTGIDAIARVRQHFGASIPALLITADRTAEVRAAAEKDGISLQNKPVRPASMRAWLTQLTAAGKQAAE